MTNRLAGAASPYLLQHAGNPVDWYPWGPEALGRARAEDKPILLSIGYAACHWCHVMAHESFEDVATAAVLNKRFVCIKVDREERPDLDQVYQLVVQLMGRGGGWPLTVFLTPDQRPFFGGTYFPPEACFGMPGFRDLARSVASAYRERREEVVEDAQRMSEAIRQIVRGERTDAGATIEDAPAVAARGLLERFDERHGGFGVRPKFPCTTALDLLLRRGVLDGDERALAAVEVTLDRMRAGGLWDHLGGGFHRYSTDERWLVPHFEKMLYDNGLLLRLYVDGYRVFGKEAYAETARGIVRYLLTEMRDEGSSKAFFASQDADSAGGEGAFFVWTPDDLRACLGDGREARIAARHFGVTSRGNFEGTRATVLSEVESVDTIASDLDMTVGAVREELARAKALMLACRARRPRPQRDQKVLASWNGLALGALAEAGCVLGERGWIGAAVAAFEGLEAGLVRDGRVGRYLKDGKRAGYAPGFLDDHAFMGHAALDLYEATAEPRFVASSMAIAREMVAHHWDPGAGTFYYAPDDGEALVARAADTFDQSTPAASVSAALLCLRLGALVHPPLGVPGERQLEALATAADSPIGMALAVTALDRLVRGPTTVFVVGERRQAETLWSAVHRAFIPDRVLALADPSVRSTLDAVHEAAIDKPAPTSGAAAYVCAGRTCSAPVGEVDELLALLRPPGRR